MTTRTKNYNNRTYKYPKRIDAKTMFYKLGERTKKRTTTTILTLKNLRSFIPKGRFLTFLNSYLSPVMYNVSYRKYNSWSFIIIFFLRFIQSTQPYNFSWLSAYISPDDKWEFMCRYISRYGWRFHRRGRPMCLLESIKWMLSGGHTGPPLWWKHL